MPSSLRFINTFLGVSLLALGLAGLPAEGQSKAVATSVSEWARFTSEEGGFSVRLPREPQKSETNLQAAGMSFVFHEFTCSSNGNEFLMVGYLDVPTLATQEYKLNDLARNLGAAIASEGGRVVSSEAVHQGNCQGRDMTGRGPGAVFRQGRVFVSGFRIYIAAYSIEIESKFSASVAIDFLDTVEVIGGCKPAMPSTVEQTGPVQ